MVPYNMWGFLKKLVLESGEGSEKERRGTSMCKRNTDWLPLTPPQPGTWPATQAHALTGNGTGDL